MRGPRGKLDEGEGEPGHLPPAAPLNLVHSALSTASSSWVLASGWLFLDPARGLKR